MNKAKYYISFVVLACICACNNSRQFEMPSKNELVEIIDAVIKQNSLPVINVKSQKTTGTTTEDNSYPLLRNLRKITITVPDTTTRKGLVIERPRSIETISIFTLLSNFGFAKKKPSGGIAISKPDYEYLLYQNTVMKEFAFDNAFQEKLNLVEDRNSSLGNKSKMPKRYYELTIPIVSRNGLKSYIEITFVCGGLCSSAKGIYLEKKNGKWLIVNREELWTA